MSNEAQHRLGVLVANEDGERLAAVSAAILSLGHRVVAAVTDIDEVGAATAREHPDVALVALGDSSEHALALIGRIVGEAECPVVAVLTANDPAFVSAAAKRGIFAYLIDTDIDSLRNALEIVLLRFGEYHGLQGAFARRSITERAKGILMERHGVDERAAFELLRNHARNNNKTIVDVAGELIAGRLLLPPG